MTTAVTMQNQLVELRMLIDRNDPVQVEAEAAFAAMVARVMRETGAETSGSIASRVMLGTAEAYDPLAQDVAGVAQQEVAP